MYVVGGERRSDIKAGELEGAVHFALWSGGHFDKF